MGKESFVYMSVYNDLFEKIKTGVYKPGARLPAENEMKDQYGVSRDTIRRALAKLEKEGYLSRKAATGTFLHAQKTDYQLSHHESFSEQMRAIGMEPSSDICSIQISSDFDRDIHSQLEIGEDEKVYKICRLRKANGEPMAFETVYIPEALCPNIHTHILEDTSLYELYENYYGHKMGFIKVNLESEAASGETQRKLKLPNNAPILKVTSTMRLVDGRPLYYVISEHIGGKYVFSTTLPRKL